ncbi:MAG TPA: hypothetical protein VGI39_43430 [Polyangiaceae bacterium]|jgi:hypothetical protein
MPKPAYSGPERRRRRVYVTQNHEYHCQDGVCVAVRDRGSRELSRVHPAVGKRMVGAVVLNGAGGIASIAAPEDAAPGQRVHFAVGTDDRNDVLTSSLRSIERPARDVVAQYDR